MKFRIDCLDRRRKIRRQKQRADYFTVHIFDSKKEMYEAEKKYPTFKPPLDFEAITHTIETYTFRTRKWNVRGDIFFYKRALGSGIVAHEMTHAALYWFEKRVGLINRKNEEELAWCLGSLVAQFWRKFYRLSGDRKRQGNKL